MSIPKPMGKRVIISAFEKPTETATGIILAPQKDDSSQVGVIVAVGDITMPLNVGDKVIVKKFSGTKIEVDDINYVVHEMDDILVVL